MPTEVVMPALGVAQETGKLIRWLKSEGEQVSRGEPLMEVETDKATVEVESPASGTLAGITADGGEDIPVGKAIALILAPGESVGDWKRPSDPIQKVQAAAGAGPNRQEAPSSRQTPERARPSASPKARRLAAERGVDLATVVGSGPGGVILEDDILQAGGGAAP